MWDKTASNKYAEVKPGYGIDYNRLANHHDALSAQHRYIAKQLRAVGESGPVLQHHDKKDEQHSAIAQNYRFLSELNANDNQFDPQKVIHKNIQQTYNFPRSAVEKFIDPHND
jgi:hypothetical protein